MRETDSAGTEPRSGSRRDEGAPTGAPDGGDDPFARATAGPPGARGYAIRAIAIALVVVVVVVIIWQFLTLHHQVNSLRKTDNQQQAQLAQARNQIQNLSTSFSATAACLAGSQVPKTLCLQFNRP